MGVAAHRIGRCTLNGQTTLANEKYRSAASAVVGDAGRGQNVAQAQAWSASGVGVAQNFAFFHGEIESRYVSGGLSGGFGLPFLLEGKCGLWVW